MVKGNIVKVIYAKKEKSERRKRGMDIKVDNVSGRHRQSKREVDVTAEKE